LAIRKGERDTVQETRLGRTERKEENRKRKRKRKTRNPANWKSQLSHVCPKYRVYTKLRNFHGCPAVYLCIRAMP
jgi:hypothetical protein